MLSPRSTLIALAAGFALGGCIALPDDLPQARFDGGTDGAGGNGGNGGTGGTGGSGRAPADAAIDALAPDAAPAPETCNGLDDDLDDSIDEGVRNACGECGDVVEEICDTYDNDCDLVIDEAEECACEPGREEACGRDVGACTAGTRRCSPDGQWGPCSGLGPQSEVCNDIDDNCNGDTDEDVLNACGGCGELPREECNGVDDDCDGVLDGRDVDNDLCPCPPGTSEACGSDTGECRTGERRCDFEGWGPCSGGVQPAAEVCNQRDDDCDGMVDNGVCDCRAGDTRACGSDVGYCQEGTQTCVDGRWGGCLGSRGARNEICNRVDDNCDGEVDDGACDCDLDSTRVCGVDRGVCREGTQTCFAGGWGPCDGAIDGDPNERCNGLDDNCDGLTDEPWATLGNACATGTGACRDTGQIVCTGNGSGTRCNAQAGAGSPEICNNIDDDCDGRTDEGTDGGGCDTEADGICAAGTEACIGGVLQCQETTGGEAEGCNGLDDDCDGRTDEGAGGGQCQTGQPGRCASGVWACDSGELICEPNLEPTRETCNGVDDNCDGQVDNSPLLPANCVVRGFGICASGVPRCEDGETVCDTPSPRDEVCNGVDDDCDGSTDEGLGGAECSTGQPGICNSGTTVCDGDGILCEQNVGSGDEGQPDSSTCNGLDDDCDGTIDEGHPSQRACDRGIAGYTCNNGRIEFCAIGPDPEPGPDPEEIPR